MDEDREHRRALLEFDDDGEGSTRSINESGYTKNDSVSQEKSAKGLLSEPLGNSSAVTSKKSTITD